MRRNFLVSMLLLTPFIIKSQDKPNIILIYADDLGFGDLSCYNVSSKVKTPNIDKLAEKGVRFIDAHAGSAISSPSRYAILTGSYSWRTSRKRGNPDTGEQPWIIEGRTTIASMLSGNGYNTAAIGKWGLGADWKSAEKPGRKGNDVSQKSIDYTKPIYAAKTAGFTYESLHYWFRGMYRTHYPCHDLEEAAEKIDGGGRWYFENGISMEGEPRFKDFDMEEAQLYYIDKAVEYIDVAGGTKYNKNFNIKKNLPFFMYYAPHIPHYPHVPAKQFQGTSGVGLYGDFIHELDWAVGRIVTALERNKLLDNTIIIFTSDNGPEVQAYEYIKKYGHRSMGELRGIKRDLYQGGHTTPFIVSYPKKFKQGIVTDRLVSQTDILRTLADYLDIDLDKRYSEDSFSFLDELSDDLEGSTSERTFAIHHSASGDLALRDGDWIFINRNRGDDSNREKEWFRHELGVIPHNEQVELYNLKQDPRQLKNLSAVYPERVQKMMRDLLKYVYEGSSVILK